MAERLKYRRNQDAINTLARNVRKYRTDRQLTIEELANISNLDYSQVGRIERGLSNATISTIFEIATALGVKPEQLLE